jgi:antitoxin component YwqK of YwqJK toxin-antitoxin module
MRLTVIFLIFFLAINSINGQELSETGKMIPTRQVKDSVGTTTWYKKYTNIIVKRFYSYQKRKWLFGNKWPKKEGISFEYHDNGRIHKLGAYHKDKKIGLWQYFTKDGRLDFERLYSQKGKLINQVSFIDSETKIKELIEELEKEKKEK